MLMLSGATEPMIRVYEQNKQDISKAESAAVLEEKEGGAT